MQRSIIGLCRRVGSASPHWRPPAPLIRKDLRITPATVCHLDRLSPSVLPHFYFRTSVYFDELLDLESYYFLVGGDAKPHYILGLCRSVFSCPDPARRYGPTMALASAYLNRHLGRPSRVKAIQPHSFIPFSCAATKCMETPNTKCIDTSNVKEKAYKDDIPESENIWYPPIYKNSTHRDGAIYENMQLRKEWFDVDITDRNETSLDPMMLAKATETCSLDQGYCLFHFPQHMLQFFSVTLVESPVSNGPIQLYGYIAVRDERDGMLNYVLNHSRDNPIFVQQGSLIEMTGPKRAIHMISPVLIEFDMRIKNGEQEEDDLELIDGAIAFRDQQPCEQTKDRLNGKYGVVDISLGYIEHAVEATIEISISEVQMGFSLSLSSYIYFMEDYKEIQLFHGTMDQPRGLRRFVVAVTMGTAMLLKFKVGNDNVVRYRTFKAKQHGSASRKIKLDLASFSVKVTWSTI